MSDLTIRVRTIAEHPGLALDTDPKTGLQIAGLLALVPTAAILLVRIAINAPFAPALPYSGVYDPIAATAVVGPSLGAIIIAITTRDDVRRVTLAFAGVFGIFSLFARPAVVPASVVIVLATGAVLGTALDRPFSPDEIAEAIVGFAFLSGVTISVAASLGIEPATTRSLGSTLTLLAIASTPVLVEWRFRAALAGIVGAIAFTSFGLSAPFVTGAASLVGGAIVGVSLPVMTVAVLGGVTTVTTGIDRRSIEITVGGLLLLTAGIPATVPRGLALLIALTLLLPVEDDS